MEVQIWKKGHLQGFCEIKRKGLEKGWFGIEEGGGKGERWERGGRIRQR